MFQLNQPTIKNEVLTWSRDLTCTDSYITCGSFKTLTQAQNLMSYLKTKFVRYLILQSAASINLSKATYQFVPMQDFNEPWTDEKLYKKYGITKEEQAFIEPMIKPMAYDDLLYQQALSHLV